jgi:hypothetical protein
MRSVLDESRNRREEILSFLGLSSRNYLETPHVVSYGIEFFKP